MLYSTHLFFSKIIYENMLCGNCVKIKKVSFKYGNIKPDLMLNFKEIPHNYASSANYIVSQINFLIGETKSLKELLSKEFAVKLGIIDHYVADFFCMPHNKNLIKKNIIAHYIYERKIDAICKQIKICKLKEYIYTNGIVLRTDICISDFINSRYDNYKKKSFSAINDVLFAIQTCISVNNYVIETCMSNFNSIAAKKIKVC